MKHSISGACGLLSLRPLLKEDIEAMRVLRNRNREQFVFSGEITPEGQQTWYARYLETPGDYMFSIYYETRWIGAVAIYAVADGCAEFGRLLIDRQAVGRGGLGVDATKTACRIAFEQLGVERICLEVYCDNPAAQITYLKAGFCPVAVVQAEGQRSMLHMQLEKNESTI